MTRHSRRSFLIRAGIAGGTAVLLPWRALRVLAAPALYKGVTYLTPAYHALMYGIEGFVKELRTRSDDAFDVSFYDSGSLMKADQQVSGLRVGTIQFMFHTTTYITDDFPMLGITGLPGICEHLYDHGERIAMESPLWKLINDELAKKNMFMLTAGGGVIEPQYIWSGQRKLTSLEDLSGTRCRVVGQEAAEILASFGVQAVRIPSSQTYLALQRQAVDAVVANISTIIGRNLHEQLHYCYQLPVTAYSIAVFLLKETWDGMPDRHRAAFWDAGRWYDSNAARTINTRIYPEQYWPLIKKAGITIIQPGLDEKARFARQAQPIWSSWQEKVGRDLGQRAIGLALGDG